MLFSINSNCYYSLCSALGKIVILKNKNQVFYLNQTVYHLVGDSARRSVSGGTACGHVASRTGQ